MVKSFFSSMLGQRDDDNQGTKAFIIWVGSSPHRHAKLDPHKYHPHTYRLNEEDELPDQTPQ